MNSYTDKEFQIKSIQYRKALLKDIKIANSGHTGGSISCVNILNVLYNDVLNVSPENFSDNNRDRYIQSKGHSVEALYVVLADKGFFPESDLNEAVVKAAKDCKALITVEEHSINGGLSEACASVLMQAGIHVPFRIVGFPDDAIVSGSQTEIFSHYGISDVGLSATALKMSKV
jgi:hypothetical protein